jgi:pseudo-rSAM protein
MNKHKFFVYNHVYVAKTSGGEMLLYDTKSGNHFETTSAVALKIIDEIYKPVNLDIMDFSEEYLGNTEAMEFVDTAVKMNLGKLIQEEERMSTVINLLPILNLQDDIERISQDPELSIGENSIRYLNELNIYLNEDCRQSCSFCNSYYRQTKSCHKGRNSHYLPLNTVKLLLDSLEKTSLKTINILGGNIFLYPFLKEQVCVLQKYDFEFHFYYHLENVPDDDLLQNFHKEVIITFPMNIKLIERYAEKYQDNKDLKYRFFVENEDQIMEIEDVKQKYSINNYNIIPIYNGINMLFFDKNVYLDKEDIFSSIIEMRKIFCNQKLNINNFGKLFILRTEQFGRALIRRSLGVCMITPCWK